MNLPSISFCIRGLVYIISNLFICYLMIPSTIYSFCKLIFLFVSWWYIPLLDILDAPLLFSCLIILYTSHVFHSWIMSLIFLALSILPSILASIKFSIGNLVLDWGALIFDLYHYLLEHYLDIYACWHVTFRGYFITHGIAFILKTLWFTFHPCLNRMVIHKNYTYSTHLISSQDNGTWPISSLLHLLYGKMIASTTILSMDPRCFWYSLLIEYLTCGNSVYSFYEILW